MIFFKYNAIIKMPLKNYKVNPTSFVDYNEASFRNFNLGLPTDTLFNNRDYNIRDNVIFSKKQPVFKLGMSNTPKTKKSKASSKSLKSKAKKTK